MRYIFDKMLPEEDKYFHCKKSTHKACFFNIYNCFDNVAEQFPSLIEVTMKQKKQKGANYDTMIPCCRAHKTCLLLFGVMQHQKWQLSLCESSHLHLVTEGGGSLLDLVKPVSHNAIPGKCRPKPVLGTKKKKLRRHQHQ